MNDKAILALVDKIVSKGLSLPFYDYEYRKFVSAIPENISLKEGAMGTEKLDMHDTFLEACIRLASFQE